MTGMLFGSSVGTSPHALPGGDYSGALVVDLHPGTGWFQNAGKTTVAGPGDPVHVWVDAEATYDATQSTGSLQGLVEATPSFNGYYGVSFDATDDTMATAAFAAELTQPFTVAVVYTHGGGGNCRLASSNSVTSPYIERRFASSGIRYYGGSATATYTGVGAVGVAIGVFNGASSYFLDAAGAFQNTNLGTANFDRLNIRPTDFVAAVTICRALVIDAALDESSRNALRDYLNSTYVP